MRKSVKPTKCLTNGCEKGRQLGKGSAGMCFRHAPEAFKADLLAKQKAWRDRTFHARKVRSILEAA